MITILSGQNSYRLRAEARKLVAVHTSKYGDDGLERLDGEAAVYERLQEALQSMPFLTERKLVVLTAPGANKQFAANAETLLKELPETIDVVLLEPKLDKRSAYYKFLKKQSGFSEHSEPDAAGLASWLATLADEQGVHFTSADARYLIERIGPNQQALSNELDKLALYALAEAAGGQARISREYIELLTVATPQSTIFSLIEAAFSGNVRRATTLYEEQRALKVEPQQIIAMLTWQLHILILVKAAGTSATADSIARDAKLSPYVLKKSLPIARGRTMARLRELINQLARIDDRLKQQSVDADDVLLHYIFDLASD